ncbi:MAG: helix-turn-helix transcriptional regulator [Actinomycetota bacterium]|nr:helix-turn-helix transcriptional regulator [Actinomycetota bacterium]
MMETWLPHKLRTLRVRQGLTLVEAAKKTGVTRATLSELERGHRHPVAPTLVKIAEGYGVPVEELLLEEPALAGKAEAPEAGPTDEVRRGRVEGWADYVRWRAGKIEQEIKEKIPDPDSSQTYDGEKVYRWSSGLIQECEAYEDYRDELKPSLSGDEARMLDSALDRLWQILEAGRARDRARGGAWDRAAVGLREKQPARPVSHYA